LDVSFADAEQANRKQRRRRMLLIIFMVLKRRGSLRGGSGGLDRDDAAGGDEYGGGLYAEHDGLVGGASVGQVAVAPVHADVVAGAVEVVVLGVGRALVDAGGGGLQVLS
jgi:hypothetical protein